MYKVITNQDNDITRSGQRHHKEGKKAQNHHMVKTRSGQRKAKRHNKVKIRSRQGQDMVTMSEQCQGNIRPKSSQNSRYGQYKVIKGSSQGQIWLSEDQFV